MPIRNSRIPHTPEVAEKLSMQQDILMKIASKLGLNKNNNAKQKG